MRSKGGIPADRRRSEHGISLLEALICLVIISLMAAILLPLTGAATIKALDRAGNSVSVVDHSIAEEKLRLIMRSADIAPKYVGAAPSSFGDAISLSFLTNASTISACGGAGSARVTLKIVTDGAMGALQCIAAGRKATLLQWRQGAVRFQYSADGLSWTSDLQSVMAQAINPGDAQRAPNFTAPLVAFVLETKDTPSYVVIERIGASGAPPPVSTESKPT